MHNDNLHGLSMDQLDIVTGGGKMDGIGYLVAVTQLKASNANDQAMSGAQFQSAHIGSSTARLWR